MPRDLLERRRVKVDTRTRRRGIIIGGSLSGLFAALALRRRGWDVDVFERVEAELAGRGAGIVVQPQVRAVFAAIGLDPAAALGVTVQRRRTLDFEGAVIGEAQCPQTVTSWDQVYRLLRDAFPSTHYHRGHSLVRVETHDGSVSAHFADAPSVKADLLVGADGLRSAVREQFVPGFAPLYAGYIAWRALVPERAFPRTNREDLFDVMAFCLPPGEQALGYPIVGADNAVRSGRRRYNFVWYRPADEQDELPDLLTDASGLTHGGSIPPPLIRADVIAQMREAAMTRLAAPFREVVRLATHPFIQPIYDLESPRMAFGRVAIVGDAAFVARPHVAAGVVKAAEDALCLAEALEQIGDVEQALRQFEQTRRVIGQRIVERARHLGAAMQAQQRTFEERARATRHHTPEAVMAETALMDFLYR
jgi:2-polyprenyl-6-methoxyphenol hydroxylase-like FAD-dependent oxidoreductase